MTQDQLRKAADLAKSFLETFASTSEETPKPDSSDAARLRIASILLTIGIGAASSSYMYAPVLFIPSFCLFFVGFGLTLVGVIDKWFFPETNTFQRIAEDARATSTMFLSLVLLVIGGIFAGSAIVQIPSSTAEEVGTVIYQSAEPSDKNSRIQEKTSFTPDTAGRGYNGASEGE